MYYRRFYFYFITLSRKTRFLQSERKAWRGNFITAQRFNSLKAYPKLSAFLETLTFYSWRKLRPSQIQRHSKSSFCSFLVQSLTVYCTRALLYIDVEKYKLSQEYFVPNNAKWSGASLQPRGFSQSHIIYFGNWYPFNFGFQWNVGFRTIALRNDLIRLGKL